MVAQRNIKVTYYKIMKDCQLPFGIEVSEVRVKDEESGKIVRVSITTPPDSAMLLAIGETVYAALTEGPADATS